MVMGRIIKNILGILERCFFFIGKRKGLYVINYHGTPETMLENFTKHLQYYKAHFEFISIPEFELMCKTGKLLPHQKPFLLLTFDDGMKNNIHAARILGQFGIKAFFFVIPAFIDAEAPEKYLASVIRPGYSNQEEKNPEDFQPMDWAALKQLSDQGHKIGSHTYTHTLQKQDDEQKSRVEIIDSRKYIEEKLIAEVPYFCSINNTSLSVGPLQKQMIDTHYNYHFTTFYGHNNTPVPLNIQRINIEAYWHMNEVRFALGHLKKYLNK
jgi:peptidoglycan/xylan/chitin deacetylase (PgdA/CDA1 family)